MARTGADTDELRAFTTLHLGWDHDLARLLLGSDQLVADLASTPAGRQAGVGLRDVLDRLARIQPRCVDADDEPQNRAGRFDLAMAGGGTVRRSLRTYGARTARAARAGGGSSDTRRFAIRDAESCIDLLKNALASGDTGKLEDAIRRIWRRFGGKGSDQYKLLFAQALLHRLPPAAVWQITRVLDTHGRSLTQKSDELAAWAKLFGRATRAPGGIGPAIRNLLITRRRDGSFAFADEVVTLCAIDPRLVSGPWRGLAAAMTLGGRGLGLGANQGVAASLLLHDPSAQRWFWKWGERFGTITAGNLHHDYLRRVVAGQMSRHAKDVINALVALDPGGQKRGARYAALIKEIVAEGGKGREALLAMGAKLLAGFHRIVAGAPTGGLDLQRAGALWQAIIAGFKQGDDSSNAVRGYLAKAVGDVGSIFGPIPVKILTKLVVTPGLTAILGSSNEAVKRKAEVLAAAYPSILAGILESDKGAAFRHVHPDLFRNGKVRDLGDVLKVLSSKNADQGGPTDKVRLAADHELDLFRSSLGGT